jgi:hypothetical protein
MRSVRKSNVLTACKRPDLQPRFVLPHPSPANWLLPFLQLITHYPSRIGTRSTPGFLAARWACPFNREPCPLLSTSSHRLGTSVC